MDCAKQNIGKAHVVYYLSRGAQLEHPHLLEVQFSSGDGLLLKDVKKRLTAIRGRSMPNCFSWSYKRNYKDGYIWHDVSDDDHISPICGQEYVLKGSEMSDHCREKSASALSDFVHQSLRSGADKLSRDYELRQNFLQPTSTRESNVIYEKLMTNEACQNRQTSDLSCFNPTSDVNSASALSVNRQVIDTFIQAKPHPEERMTIDEFAAADNIPSDESSNQKFNAVKVYTIAASSPTVGPVHAKEATARTDAEERCSKYHGQSKEMHKQHADVVLGARSTIQAEQTILSGPSQEESSPGLATSFSESSDTKRKILKIMHIKTQQEDNPAGKAIKQATSAMVLRQLLSCGGIETKEKNSSSTGDSEGDTNLCLSVEEPTTLYHSGQNWSWRRSGLKCSKIENKSIGDRHPQFENDKIDSDKDQIHSAQLQNDDSKRYSSETIKLWQSNLSPSRMQMIDASVTPNTLSIDTPIKEHRNDRIVKLAPVNYYAWQRESSASRSLNFPTKGEVKEMNRNDNKEIPILSPISHFKREGKIVKEVNKAEKSTQEDASNNWMSPDQSLKSNAKVSKKYSLISATDNEKKGSPISSPQSKNSCKELITEKSLADPGKHNLQSLPSHFENLSPPKKDFKSRDERPLTPGRSKLDWENTFREAVSACTVPEDFRQILKECVHCGRTFKPDSLKVHMRGCHDNVRSKHTSTGPAGTRSTAISTRARSVGKV